MTLALQRSLPENLRQMQREIERHAKSYGLDFFDTFFELVSHQELNEVAAYGGFPIRYPHWRFGMEYEQLSKGYVYGLSKIYELVINNNPCYAYLMDSNALVDQKLVMAHVYGHCDFFKCNQWFSQTSRKMVDEMANHGNRIRDLMDKHGTSEVEDFIDICLSLEDLIDVYSPFIKRHDDPPRRGAEEKDAEHHQGTRFETKDYLESFVNPREALKAEMDRLDKEEVERASRYPREPQKDVLLFLIEHGSIKPWQREVLSIIRDEAYYFAPQGQTKIMNEGWASYWHSTIMTQKELTDAEIIDFADHHSGTMAMGPGQFNPYKVGIELYRDVEERWNKGQFGKAYDECDNHEQKKNWDLNLGLGRKKIFEVRRIHNDVTFIDEFLTEEFCRRHKLFSFAFNRGSRQYEIESREFDQVKDRLLFQLTNHGRPFIYVTDSNYRNRKELYLVHKYLGADLKIDYARDVMSNLFKIWSRPVHVETFIEDRPILMTYDGSEHKAEQLEKPTQEMKL